MTVADKAYLVHVTRGAELLRADKVDEARAELERANQLKPSDGRIMNLLGLTFFRLGRYPEAQAIYAELVKRSPKEPSLRLNLGLVHLKRGDVDDAIRELTRARELDPSQLRTMGYLGLAFARKGRYALARDAFHAAGQDELAKEMDQQLALEMRAVEEEEQGRPRPRRQTLAGIRAIEAAALPIASASVPPVGQSGPVASVSASGASGPVTAAAEPVPASTSAPAPSGTSAPAPSGTSRPNTPIPVPPPRLTLEPAVSTSSSPTAPVRHVTSPGEAGPEGVTLFVRRRLIRPDGRDVPFEVAAGQALIVRVKGRVYSRSAGVLVSGGQLSFEPVQRKTRARQTGEPFGHGDLAMALISGNGHLVALPRGGVFAALQLDGEVVYLREDLVFAFEERLSWENGHVPGSNGAIPVVQLRGDGCVAVRSQRPLLGIEVHGGRLLRVAASALAGWTGSVVPRVAGGEPALVECAGEGAVLIEEPH